MKYVMIGLIALCAGILQGVTGFGAGIIMMMVLPVFFPLNQAAGISCAIAVVLSFSMFVRYRTHIQIKKAAWPAFLYVAVSSCSIIFSARVDQDAMKKVFGVFLVILSVYYLFLNNNQKKESGIAVSVIFIAVSGVCDGLFGIGGPLMVLFFLSRTGTREEYLGSIQGVFLVNLIYGTMVRMVNHILTPVHLPYIGVGMACILTGLMIANKIADRLDGEKIRKITYLFIGISGILNVL